MDSKQNDIESLPNIGKHLAEKLKFAGITTPALLKLTGSEDAFIKLKTIDKDCCLNSLYALEGAIQEIRWHNLSPIRKQELKEFFLQLKTL